MRLLATYIIAILLIGFSVGNTTIINIPADYPTIQQGIDSSIDGDTVLVQPGTYVENIMIIEHNILLGSLFLTTGDSGFISQTVIDGNNTGRAIYIFNSSDDLHKKET